MPKCNVRIDVLKRHWALFWLCSLSFLFVMPVQAQKQFPLQFDFGPAQGKHKRGFTIVHRNTIYDPVTGYGLLQPAESDFSSQAGSKHADEMKHDGVASRESLVFKVDIPPAKYWVELFMSGGEKGTWSGQISVNGELLVDTIYTYQTGLEGESPPVYWQLLHEVEVEGNSLTINVIANDQSATLNGILIYRALLGPLTLRNGQVRTSVKLRAPNATLALALINKGRPVEAQRIIAPIPEREFGFEKALLLLALAGRLEVPQPRSLIEWAARLLRDEWQTNANPGAAFNLHFAQLFIEADNYFKMGGWDWARESSGQGIFTRLDMAGFALEEITQVPQHPLYHAALWHLGKLSFWGWVEQHDPWQKNKADACFAILKPFNPNHALLHLYLGEYLPSIGGALMDEQKTPLWALTANRALKEVNEIIHYWVENRQAENGEFGGKYDDDVEMLRWWPVARLAADDQTALKGMRKLVDGIWNSGWIVNGFSRKLRDVEHAAEPVADTQPMMIGLDYGNPIYVERCMESIRGLQELWTGVNSRGHRHFKSSWYSSTAIDTRPPRDCDVPMNARTVKAATWLAWYNRHPFAMQFLREWADAWLEDCLRTDKGKPYGVVPAAIRFEDDAIGGHADNWHHPGMFWHYYNFRGGTRMLQQFLATYLLTDDARYLQPIELALKIVVKYKGEILEDALMGSETWVAGILSKSGGFKELIEQWRLLTGRFTYDDIISKVGSNYLKFRLTGDKDYLIRGSEEISGAIKFNHTLVTTEAYFTDRVDIGYVHQSKEIGVTHLEAMFTGQALLDSFFPFYAVSWQGLGDDFAAVVLEANSKTVRILVYNFAEQNREGALSFWMLSPGQYEFRQGADENEDRVFDAVSIQDEFTVRGRGDSHPVVLPARSLQLLEVRQKQPAPERTTAQLADLAITASEVRIKGDEDAAVFTLEISVHNIGIAAAENVVVELRKAAGGKQVTLASRTIASISAPLDLIAKKTSISFRVSRKDLESQLSILVDPADKVLEITEINNRVDILQK